MLGNYFDLYRYLRSLRDPENLFLITEKQLSESLPIGTYTWIVGGGKFCEHKPGDFILLTFSKCFPNMYTCDSGECIDLR